MAYVNFEEERYKANKQLEKRVANNKSLINMIINDQDLIKYKGESQYSYKTNKGLIINNDKIEQEENFAHIQNKNFICAKFEKCKFFNINFTNCKFIGCEFIDCEFGGGGVIFEKCTMYYKESFNSPNLNIDSNLSSSFRNCQFYCKFNLCDLSYAVIKGGNISNSLFKLTSLNDIIIKDTDIKNIVFEDDNLCGCKFINTYIKNIDFNDQNKTKLSEKSFFDKIQPRKKDKQEYEGIYNVYQTIANIFDVNKLKNNFGEFYFLCKKTQKKTLKFFPKIRSYVYHVTCGYGERPVYSLITSLIIIIIFSIIYLLIGIEVDKKNISLFNYMNSSLSFWGLINESICLSIGLFACMGVTNGVPSSAAFFFSNLEMILGAIIVGIAIGTLTRKLVR